MDNEQCTDENCAYCGETVDGELQLEENVEMRNNAETAMPAVVGAGEMLFEALAPQLAAGFDPVKSIHCEAIVETIEQRGRGNSTGLLPVQDVAADLLYYGCRDVMVAQLAKWAEEWGCDALKDAIFNDYVKKAGRPDLRVDCEYEVPITVSVMVVIQTVQRMIFGEASIARTAVLTASRSAELQRVMAAKFN